VTNRLKAKRIERSCKTHDLTKGRPDIPNAKPLSKENGAINKLHEAR